MGADFGVRTVKTVVPILLCSTPIAFGNSEREAPANLLL
jgi:hypothetical protein